ncbi:hypothetical protein CV102_23025 [Natronococcus pandeyae]|uniref:Zinc ribbon domain-containing protein n=1 Tax=Natronococcus pandeyae TaxID=2055836 RepID=A0A8J8Q033_9EURY|nr:hypothetical protein [Natronococcus pandeyae]TYL36334.1 hypothetical protein CV102_23025 [Natronococcus pandeyae]
MDRGRPYCHNCAAELEGDETVCPHCSFDPRDTGLRIALAMLIGTVLLVMLTVLSIPLVPVVGAYLVFAAFLLLVASGAVFLLAFAATPSRFSTLFTR